MRACRRGIRGLRMTATWRKTRKTFRHGNLAETLIDAALVRLEADGVESLSLRELASDAGVNHRAVYRHFPDKLSLLARVAEEGWRRLERRVRRQSAGKPKGQQTLAAASVGFYLFARDNPNLFALMAGPRINKSGAFPGLEAVMAETMAMFRPIVYRRRDRAGARAHSYGGVRLGASGHHDANSAWQAACFA